MLTLNLYNINLESIKNKLGLGYPRAPVQIKVSKPFSSLVLRVYEETGPFPITFINIDGVETYNVAGYEGGAFEFVEGQFTGSDVCGDTPNINDINYISHQTAVDFCTDKFDVNMANLEVYDSKGAF